MKYDVICDAFLDDLIKAVNEKIKKGWKLVGGIATMTHQPRYTVFYQAMTIEKQNKQTARDTGLTPLTNGSELPQQSAYNNNVAYLD